MLRIDDLHVNYGNIVALRGVSLHVAKGEIVAVIGPNGAGKSTLLLAAAGVVRPRSGSIELDGKNLPRCNLKRLSPPGFRSCRRVVTFSVR